MPARMPDFMNPAISSTRKKSISTASTLTTDRGRPRLLDLARTKPRLAKLATIALNRMDNNESRKAVIQAAFGDVLKTALTDAVARVDAAALKLDKASDKLAAGGPIDGVGGLLDC